MKTKMFLTLLMLIMAASWMVAQQKKIVQFSVTSGMETATNGAHKLQLIVGQPLIGLISSNKYKAEIGLLEGSSLISDVNDGNISDLSFSVNVIPNPASEKISISTNFPLSVATVVVYNMSGKRMKSFDISGDAVSGDNYISDISELASGTYTIILTYGSNTIVKQFVVVR